MKTVSFRLSGLFDKYGLQDGDILEEPWLNAIERHGLKRGGVWLDSTDFLERVLLELVLPQSPVELIIERVRYDHNPFRAVRVDGEELMPEFDYKKVFDDTIVTVPASAIDKIADREIWKLKRLESCEL